MKLKKKNKKKGYRKSKSYVSFGIFDKIIQFRYNVKIVAQFIRSDGDRDFEVVNVDTRKNTFIYNKKKYFVDEKHLEYYRPFKLFGGLYHEGISIPIKESLKSDDLKNAINNKNTSKEVLECISNIDPSILKSFSDSKVIEDSIQGSANKRNTDKIYFIVVISLIILIINLLIVLNMSGILSR